MTTRSQNVPRATSAPLRVGMISRKRLERLARQDSATGAPPERFDGEPEPSTPTMQAIQAHANGYARREEQRFFSRIDAELTEYRMLTRALDDDIAAYEMKTDELAPPDREEIAEGHGPTFEELRRLERRISRGRRRRDELRAVIHARFTAARLRASRYYDHSDEKIAIYWGAYRRSGTQDRTVDRAPVLRRSDWLTTTEQTKLLELWQGRTDAQT